MYNICSKLNCQIPREQFFNLSDDINTKAEVAINQQSEQTQQESEHFIYSKVSSATTIQNSGGFPLLSLLLPFPLLSALCSMHWNKPREKGKHFFKYILRGDLQPAKHSEQQLREEF